MVTGRPGRTIPFMSAPVVIDAPLNLEPVGPDSFIVDLEPRSPDAQARPSELVQRRRHAQAAYD